jgi:hypothetical protein
LKPAIDLLGEIFQRLQLKGKAFEVYEAATKEEIEEFWSVLLLIDSTLTIDDTTKIQIGKEIDMCGFIKHCCRARHYSFQVKKCGVPSRKICKPVWMDHNVFASLHFLPDPTPAGDGHYKNFCDIYGQVTSEEHRPSLQTSKKLQNKALALTQANNTFGMLACLSNVRSATCGDFYFANLS